MRGDDVGEWHKVDCETCGYDFTSHGKPNICEVCAEVRENFPEIFTWLNAIYKYQRAVMEKFETELNGKFDAINFRLDILDEKISRLLTINSPKEKR
jgi:hypothetical protein